MAEERLQRRLAAILSADVVGYSRLMGMDKAGTLSRLRNRTDCVADCGDVKVCLRAKSGTRP